jgi:predicted MPP superfamily phosphohydrolase
MLTGLAAPAVDAFTWAPRRVQVSRYDLPVAGLPAPLAGLRVAQVTDVHLYDGLHPAAQRTMELVADERPDVVLLTGDLCESTSQLRELQPMVAACRGRLATVALMGNWEHQVRIRPVDLARTCERAGAELLLNTAHLVSAGGATLALVGLDDPQRGVPDLSQALAYVPRHAVQVWAFHAPGYAQGLDRGLEPPALMLSGHTHGGQVRPPLLPPITPPGSGRFVQGWYRDTLGPLYVSRGIGTSGIRARLLCPPELPIFTLRRA